MHRTGTTYASRKIATFAWGVLAVVFAASAALLDNLIQAVNILGSLFYGPILGIFLSAFFVRRIRATPVFVAALLAEALVVGLWLASDIGFLWFNVIGCVAVLLVGSLLSTLRAPTEHQLLHQGPGRARMGRANPWDPK